MIPTPVVNFSRMSVIGSTAASCADRSVMIAWAAGYATARQKDATASLEVIAATLGDACRNAPAEKAAKAITDKLNDTAIEAYPPGFLMPPAPTPFRRPRLRLRVRRRRPVQLRGDPSRPTPAATCKVETTKSREEFLRISAKACAGRTAAAKRILTMFGTATAS